MGKRYPEESREPIGRDLHTIMLDRANYSAVDPKGTVELSEYQAAAIDREILGQLGAGLRIAR